jgi:hypothetical protein
MSNEGPEGPRDSGLLAGPLGPNTKQRIAMIPPLDAIGYSIDIPNQHSECLTLKVNQKPIEEKKAKPKKKKNTNEEEKHNYSKRGSRSSHYGSSTSIENILASRIYLKT